MLCAALKVQTVPPEVSQLVQDFSGGSYFWVHEILQFIIDHGAEQFMSAIGEKDGSVDAHDHRAARPKLKPTHSIITGSPHTAKKVASVRQLNKTASLRSPTANRTADSPHQVQLDKLVLCRFGNLSTDVQRVMRTASIIGMTFSSAVLHSVLSQQLRDQLGECLQTLLNQRWLFQDLDNESLYQFAHPHAHLIVYELTPSSERSHIHLQIADQMEAAGKTDKAHYGLLSFHYQQAKSDKALMYAAMAMDVLLEAKIIYDFGDCLDLLTGSVTCCKTVHDVDVLLRLVDRARVKIRAFNATRKASPASWLGRTLARAVRMAWSRTSSSAVAPETSSSTYADDDDLDEEVHSYRVGSSDGHEDLIPSTRSYSSRSTGSAQTAGSGSSGTSKSSNAPAPTAVSAQDQERCTKRLFLQQLHRLYDQLSEKYVDLSELLSCDGPPPEMPLWQEQLLAAAH
jgi:hypothetical protein